MTRGQHDPGGAARAPAARAGGDVPLDAQADAAREAWLKVAIEATGIGLWEWRIADNGSSWDEGMLRIFGRDAPPGDDAAYLALIYPADRERARARIQQSLQTGVYEAWEYRILRPDGSVRWVQSLGSILLGPDDKPERIVGGLIDVTERHELEAERQASQRMEAVGQLAAGVAHNFNNMLAAIVPAVEMAQAEVEEPLLSALKDAEQAAYRAAEMVRELVRFAKKPDADAGTRRLHDLAALTAHAVQLCRKMFGSHVTLSFERPALPLWVHVADGPLVQTLVNLLINARDAVEGVAYGGPAIEVLLEQLPHDAPGLPLALHGRAPALGFACVVVRDRGTGMDEAVRARIFEPFFTTKEVGRGTGLGLSTAYATVTQLGGAITCESERGVGTTMRLYLPQQEAERETAASEPARLRPAQRVRRRVLVVDDDAAVGRATGRVIASRGDEVEQARSAAEALERMHARPDVDLVVLDCEMPGTTGPAALARIRSAAPGARVLYFSGTELPATAEAADGFLQKPASARELLDAVDRALGELTGRAPRP